MTILKVLKVIDCISEWSGKIVSFFIAAMMGIIVFEVVARYIFHRPTIWAHELSVMLFGTFVIIGGAYNLTSGGHVRMDILHSRLSTKVKAIINLCVSPVFFLFVGILFWDGGDAALYSIKIWEHASTQWGPLMVPFRLILPLGAGFLLLQGIAEMIRGLLTLIKGDGPWTSH